MLIDKIAAESWRQTQLDLEQKAYADCWATRPRGGEVALMSAFGYAGGGSLEPGGYHVDFSAFAWAAALPPTTARTTVAPDVDQWQASLVTHGLNLPTLRAFKFQLAQDEAVLVQHLDPKLLRRPLQLNGYQLVLREDGLWTSWTKLPFGRIPKIGTQDSESIAAAVLANNPNSTIQQMAAERGLDSAPMEVHCYKQDFVRYASEFAVHLGGMSEEEVDALQFVANQLALAAKLPEAVPIAGAVGIPVKEANKILNTNARKKAAMSMLLGHRDCKFPLTWNEDGLVIFPPHVLWSFSVACLNYTRDPNRLTIADRASQTFERLVSKVLHESGYSGPSGEPVVGGSFTKDSGDVDVLAWNDDEVILVECKYEMQPPGAWSSQNRTKRQEELLLRLAKLQARKEACQDAFRAKSVNLRMPDKSVVALEPDLLKTRKLETILVSARLEPRFQVVNHHVVTMVGRHFETELRKRLPVAQFMPMWSAPGPLPVS